MDGDWYEAGMSRWKKVWSSPCRGGWFFCFYVGIDEFVEEEVWRGCWCVGGIFVEVGGWVKVG